MSSVLLDEIFEDLCSRFLLNLPQEECESFERLGFQLESAHWFYEDCVKVHYEGDGISLPTFSFRSFVIKILDYCPLFKNSSAAEIYGQFQKYKSLVPVCGAILLSETYDEVLLVKGFPAKTSSWNFPKGKINQTESDVDCAIREVFEEIGFDISELVNEKEAIEMCNSNGQTVKLFLIQPVPKTFNFYPQTIKEISEICWFPLKKLSDIKSFGVKQFIPSINSWIKKKKKSKQNVEVSIDKEANKITKPMDAYDRLMNFLKTGTRTEENLNNTNESKSNGFPVYEEQPAFKERQAELLKSLLSIPKSDTVKKDDPLRNFLSESHGSKHKLSPNSDSSQLFKDILLKLIPEPSSKTTDELCNDTSGGHKLKNAISKKFPAPQQSANNSISSSYFKTLLLKPRDETILSDSVLKATSLPKKKDSLQKLSKKSLDCIDKAAEIFSGSDKRKFIWKNFKFDTDEIIKKSFP